MWPFGSFLRSQYGILCFNWQDGLNVNDEIQKVLYKYEELKTASLVLVVLEPRFDSLVAVEPDSPIHAKEDALIGETLAGSTRWNPRGSNDDLMDDLDEMIFGKKGGSASEGAQDPKKDQLSKDDLITF
ncbi:TOM1-LIKE PROTEIN 1 [Salix koriyanagi]|uniref:TOM1-LIKE PROTEIN 1 n=1 Tax=Salix koriyanagi TaxID=2511006 RepID=A0A9Q0SLW6_9ROSI|nr:TOM1-LIKE PROTEIN 1 [Salix koriyanagi]